MPTLEASPRHAAPFRARIPELPPSSVVHFHVDAKTPEVQAYARAQGWLERGFSVVQVTWQELRYTTDGWKTTRILRSTDVPSPVVSGFFFLPGVARGTEVELALHVGLSCRAPGDAAGYRERGSLWFNDGGKNYRQQSR